MIQSMTGYGRAVAELQDKNVIVEIKSLNSKQLDLSSRIPAVYRDKELEIRNYVASFLVRGKIDIIISIETKETAGERTLHTDLVTSYYHKIKDVADSLQVTDFSPLDAVLRLPDVWTNDSPQFATAEEWNIVMNAVREATANIVTYRKQEGQSLDRDLRGNITTILELLASIEPFEKQRVVSIRERIETALDELIASDKIDKNRLEQEMIYYLEKLDINEEKVRLKQHCTYFFETMDGDDYAGKKLGFIAQEMGREINTTGSKSNDADMQKIVVQMKDNLEKIKEQVLNVL